MVSELCEHDCCEDLLPALSSVGQASSGRCMHSTILNILIKQKPVTDPYRNTNWLPVCLIVQVSLVDHQFASLPAPEAHQLLCRFAMIPTAAVVFACICSLFKLNLTNIGISSFTVLVSTHGVFAYERKHGY